jgi:hypothetical protein
MKIMLDRSARMLLYSVSPKHTGGSEARSSDAHSLFDSHNRS